jgi:transposase-like protein
MIDITALSHDELVRLEQQIAQRKAEAGRLTTLLQRLDEAARAEGFSDLAAALTAAGYVKAGACVEAVAPTETSSGRKPRAKITEELRTAMVAAMKAGESSSAEIATRFGVSIPTVQNIKKAAGLVRAAEKSESAPADPVAAPAETPAADAPPAL